jgi:hypothetical protein
MSVLNFRPHKFSVTVQNIVTAPQDSGVFPHVTTLCSRSVDSFNILTSNAMLFVPRFIKVGNW